MPILQLPEEITKNISNRAVQIARGIMQARGWKSMSALSPVYKDGQVGIKSDVKYLLYQETGIRPFVMWSLEGKIIPIKNKDGSIHRIKAVNVGQPGWVFIPGRGRIWRDERWKHPGFKGKNFMKTGLQMAIREHRAEIRTHIWKQLGVGARGELE